MPLALSPPIKYSHKYHKTYFKENKYTNTQLSVSGQKKIEKLLEKDEFKDITSNKIVTSEKVLSITKVFNSRFFDNIKDLYIDKVYKKSCLIMHIYNCEKKNLVLRYLSKILEVSQSISFCFFAII